MTLIGLISATLIALTGFAVISSGLSNHNDWE
jgi:hypothetical protein|nr:MAG TPA: hypothetical protein [Caudoviricetes sp.]